MPQNYYSLVTNIGLIKEAQASGGGTIINLTEIAVGDGNGSNYDPTGAATALVNEVYRTDLTTVVIDANNPNQLIIEGVIEEEIGPFFIREVGIFDSDGELFAIGKYPETFKSNFASGSGKKLYIRLIVGFVSTPSVNVIISEDINYDPNFASNINSQLNDINDDLEERLKIAENLADLEDIQAARDNLDVYAKGDVDLLLNFLSLKSPSGYEKSPNGIIRQWFGQENPVANIHNSQITFNFPAAFPTAVMRIYADFNDGATNPTSVSQCNIISNNLTSLNSIFSCQTGATISGKRQFYAIGY